jgi:capsular polysaccharide biosynthesis protein
VEITFKNLTDWMIKGIALILAVSLLFAVAAFIYTGYFVDPVYQAKVKFYASGFETVNPSANVTMSPQYVEFLNVNEFFEMVSKDLLENSGIDLTPKTIAGMLQFSSVIEDTSSFYVTAKASDPNLAYNVALSVAKQGPERVKLFEGSGVLHRISDPTLPSAPVGKSPLENAILGFLIGFVLSACIVILKEILDNRIDGADEIAELFHLPILGIVPDFSMGEKKGDRR